MPHLPRPAPPCPCLPCVNEAIRVLAGGVVEWTPDALAELDVLYRMWSEAREEADGGEWAA